MNINEFQFKSRRTFPLQGKPRNDVETNWILSNYSLGLIGEAVEVFEAFVNGIVFEKDLEEFIHEIGDVTHYAAGLASIYQLKLPTEYPTPIGKVEEWIAELLINCKTISEFTKKNVYHRKDIAFPHGSLNEVFVLCAAIAKHYGYEYGQVMQMNIDKLKNRHPNGFNANDSIKRVDTVQ
ncbi:hypothetical protein ACIQZG_04435 [Lysinibacillus sp. NPDC096418]|uniref:hypothetical protein n=1 Tax=Lysinibacillus sp. NPDC096418 TaxID=3364138 RepID=UPI003808DA7C